MTIAGACTKVDDLVEPSCTYAVSPASATYDMADGTGKLAVTAAGTCAWTASSGVSWLTITGGAKGNGNGAVSYAVATNVVTTARSAALTVAGQAATISQAAAPPCAFTIDVPSASYPASGGSGSVTVSARAGCAWTAASTASWIAVTSGASGDGSGHVAYSVAANVSTNGRSGTIAIAGQTIAIDEAGAAPPCAYVVGPGGSFSAAGGTGTVDVTTTANCAWTAASNANWITVPSGGSRTGTGAVNYTVAANASTSTRSGTLTVAGQSVTIDQAAACVYVLDASSKSFSAAGGIDTVHVTTTAGCGWTATSNDNWIMITAGNSGTDSGDVQYTVAANLTNASRDGTITIAGQTFTVKQGK